MASEDAFAKIPTRKEHELMLMQQASRPSYQPGDIVDVFLKMDTPDQRRSTSRLLFVVLCCSFGCWFPIGYSSCIYNTSQWVVIRWIRAVNCMRLSDIASSSGQTPPGNLTGDEYLWCRFIPEDQENIMLEENFLLNTIWAILGAALPAGAFMSVWLTNLLLDRFGSKISLMIINTIGVIGTILTGICVAVNSYEVFILGRIVIGMQIGLSCSVLPLYIAEISPTNLRGAMGTVPGLNFVIGSLIGTAFGIPYLFGTPELWPVLTSLRFVPAILLYFVVPFCPESPRYLIVTKEDFSAGKKALEWLRGSDDVSEELARIRIEASEEKIEGTMSILELFQNRLVRSVLLICMALFWGQQLTGITGFLFYSTGLFQSANLSKDEAICGTLGLMVAQILGTVVSLVLMDRAGRRILLLAGNIGCIIACASMVPLMIYSGRDCGWCHFGSLASVVFFIVCYSIGPSFVPWVLLAELFPNSARKSAMMVGSSNCHLGAWAIGFIFPILHRAMGEWMFAIFATITACSTVFTFFCVPETKGKSFERIQQELQLRFR